MAQIYFGIERMTLGQVAWDDIVAAIEGLGALADSMPHNIPHAAERPDGAVRLYNGDFNPNVVNVPTVKQFLADAAGVDPATVDHALSSATFDALETKVLTLSRTGTNHVRIAFFGYDGATWPTFTQSRAEAIGYLAANAVDWEVPV